MNLCSNIRCSATKELWSPRSLKWMCLVAAGLSVVFSSEATHAQSGASYDLRRWTIDGGGADMSGGDLRLGGTIGQPDAGTLAAGSFVLRGGFWPGGAAAPMATPTTATSPGTQTRTPTTNPSAVTRTATPIRSPTATRRGSVLPTASATQSGSATSPTATPSPTATTLPSSSGTPTPAGLCTGDCDHDGRVTVDELVRGVNQALGRAELSTCAAFDANDDGNIRIDELVKGVNHALIGCPE